MAFERGVSFYIYGYLKVGFPEGKACCMYCALSRRLEHDIYKCPFTGQINFTPAVGVQEDCPLDFSKGEGK